MNCDLASLITLRLTSRSLKADVTAILLAEKTRLLRFYVDNADGLWQHLEEAGAVVGGLAALNFLLRDPLSVRHSTLDIYVASDQGELLEQRLEEDETLDLENGPVDLWRVDYDHHTSRNVARTRTFICPNGRLIDVHTSQSLSALEPIAASITTALCNWVSAYAFACGYPALTLNRRSLGRDLLRRDTSVASLYIRLQNYGFHISPDPWAWPEYTPVLPHPLDNSGLPCLRAIFLCPSQGRYFGDPGTLLNAFDLENCDHDRLRSLHQPPYGIVTVWRRWSGRRRCNGPCSEHDALLPTGTLTVAAILVATQVQFRSWYVRR